MTINSVTKQRQEAPVPLHWKPWATFEAFFIFSCSIFPFFSHKAEYKADFVIYLSVRVRGWLSWREAPSYNPGWLQGRALREPTDVHSKWRQSPVEPADYNSGGLKHTFLNEVDLKVSVGNESPGETGQNGIPKIFSVAMTAEKKIPDWKKKRPPLPGLFHSKHLKRLGGDSLKSAASSKFGSSYKGRVFFLILLWKGRDWFAVVHSVLWETFPQATENFHFPVTRGMRQEGR